MIFTGMFPTHSCHKFIIQAHSESNWEQLYRVSLQVLSHGRSDRNVKEGKAKVNDISQAQLYCCSDFKVKLYYYEKLIKNIVGFGDSLTPWQTIGSIAISKFGTPFRVFI